MSVTWNCSHDSWNHEGMICFEETGVKVTFKTLLNLLTVIEKLFWWIFPMKIESYLWLMIEPKCLY